MTNRQAVNTLRCIENRLIDNGRVAIDISAAESISMGISALEEVKQYKRELDMAISQLKDLGLRLGRDVSNYVCVTKEEYKELLEYKNARS